MDELISQLGIDWKLLLAQIINFLVLLFVLYKFLYKPVLGLMEKRSKHIEESLKKAEQIEANLKETESKREQTIIQAKEEARQIIVSAKQQAEETKSKIIETSKKEGDLLLTKALEQIEVSKQRAIQEIQGEVSDLVVSAAKKIIGDNLTDKLNEKTVASAIEDLKS